MKLRPQALDCPSCGASIEVRHAAKAKSVVCGTCGAQIDLTAPGFKVLGKLDSKAEQPLGPLQLGMRGSLDGAAIEVVGRIRLVDGGDFWDEWLLLTEKGKYLWLSEEEGRFRLHRPYVPKSPPTLDEIRTGKRVRLDGKMLVIRERGQAQIRFLEGELTWKARVGDAVGYADAGHGFSSYGFEWTEDELEYFTTERLSQGALREMFELGDWGRKIEGHAGKAAQLRRMAYFLFATALLSLLAGWLGPKFKTPVAGNKGPETVPAAGLTTGVDLGQPFALGVGVGHYELSADLVIPKSLAKCSLAVVNPSGAERTLFEFQQESRRDDKVAVVASFRAAESGQHRLRLKGAGSTGAKDVQVTWHVNRHYFAGSHAWIVAILLGILGVLVYLRSNWESAQGRDPSVADERSFLDAFDD